MQNSIARFRHSRHSRFGGNDWSGLCPASARRGLARHVQIGNDVPQQLRLAVGCPQRPHRCAVSGDHQRRIVGQRIEIARSG